MDYEISMASTNKCRKFQPNIFNKSKCQNCFKPKEQHSAEALESCKAARKISKCGYLFVAPETFDFSSPLDKSRRWQRRFLVLYDDGELTYSVDDNVHTVPQGVIDMNLCTDVFDAENVTSHQFSIAVATAERVTYIKGTAKDEITRWYDVLVMYPRSNKTKTRRSPPYSDVTSLPAQPSTVSGSQLPVAAADPDQSMASASSRSRYPSGGADRNGAGSGASTGYPYGGGDGASGPQKAPITYRGVRSLKHKNDSKHKEGLRKSSSLHDLTAGGQAGPAAGGDSEEDINDARWRSRSRDTGAGRRRTDPGDRDLIRVVAGGTSSRRHSPSPPAPPRRATLGGSTRQTRTQEKHILASHKPLVGSAAADQDTRSRSPTSSLLLNGRNKNETDERKMAKSGDLASRITDHVTRESSPRSSPSRPDPDATGSTHPHSYQDMNDPMYMKKGWLLKQGAADKEWTKHWFVLSGFCMRYYQDSTGEQGTEDGVIHLNTCQKVDDIKVSRNYGFKITTASGEYVLSAMTSGIRFNWIQAIEKCMESLKSTPEESSQSQPQPSPSSSTKSFPWSSSSKAASTPEHKFGPRGLAQTDPRTSSSSSSIDGKSLKPRRLTLDDNKMSVSRESVKEKNHKHRISCTWPYVSPDREVSDEPKDDKVDGGKRSQVAEAVSEQQRGLQRRLSSEEQKELDNVERNIRRIHRKSITEHVHQHRLPHFDKFETGSAFKSDSSVSSSRERLDSAGSSYSSSPSRRQRHDSQDSQSRPKSPGHRAPSVKVKDKSHSKSPRPKSPPLASSTADMVDAIVQQNGERDGRAADDFMDDIIEKKWREVRHQVESGGARYRADDVSGASSVSGSVMDLLETEVEKLKSRLEQTQLELLESRQTNLDLKTQIYTFRKQHQDSLNEMELDQSRYLTQVEDLREEMDHATEYYKQKINDQDSRATMSKLQAQTLREQLTEAKIVITRKDEEIQQLQVKLEGTTADLANTEATLTQAVTNAQSEAKTARKKAQELEDKVRGMQSQLNIFEHTKTELKNEIQGHRERILAMQFELEDKSDRLEAFEGEESEMEQRLRHELEEKEQLIIDLQQEVSMSKQQLRSQDEDMEKVKKDHVARVKEMEDELYREKDTMDAKIQKLQKRLEEAAQKQNMGEILREKDHTIAQLEERLIENDTKIHELQEEIHIEIEDNNKLHTSLEIAYEDKEKFKAQLEAGKANISTYEEEISRLRDQNRSLSTNRTDLQKESEILKQKNEELKRKQQELIEENGALKMVVDEQGADLENWEEKYENDIDELKQSLGDREGYSNERQKLVEENEKLKKELNMSREELIAFQNEYDSVCRERNKQSERLEKTLVEVGDLSAKLHEKDKFLDDTRQEIQKLSESYKKDKDMVSETDYEELKKKYNGTNKELTQVKHKLKETEVRCDQLEQNTKVFQDKLNSSESGSNVETTKLQEKISDLEKKLGVAERRVKRFEARRKSGNFDEREDVVEQIVQVSNVSAVNAAPVDAALSAKNKSLEQELSIANCKVKELSALLLDQRSLQFEINRLKQSEQRLKHQNEEYHQKMKSVEQKMDTKESKHVDKVESKLNEVQFKLNQIESIVRDCKDKIHDVVSSFSPTNLQKHSATLATVEHELAVVLQSKIDKDIPDEEKIRLFGEKLALEAIITSEMSYLVRANEIELFTEKEKLVHEIEEANHRMLLLEQTIQNLQVREQSSMSHEQSKLLTLNHYAKLLSQKMILQGQLETLVHERTKTFSNSPRSVASHSQTAENLAQESLFRSKLDERLNTSNCSSQTNTQQPLFCIHNKAIVQGELSVCVNKLKSRLMENLSEKEKIAYIEQELSNSKSNLLQRQLDVESLVESFKQKQLSELAAVIVKQASQQAHAVGGAEAIKNTFDKEFVQSEVTLLVNKYTEYYEDQLSMDTSSSFTSRSSLIDEIVQREIQQTVEELVHKCEEIIGSKVEVRATNDSEKQETEAHKLQILMKLVDVLAQKAVMMGQVAYVSQQLGTDKDHKQSGAHQKLKHKRSLKRDDSGIIVQSASMPTSPTGQFDQIDQAELGEKIQQDAMVKSEIASFLVNNRSNSSAPNSQSLDSQITKLAAEMAGLDINLMNQGSMLSLNSYADFVAREAVFQAQLTYIVNLLKLRHNKEIDLVRTEFMTNEEQWKAKHESHIAELEEEIHRLGTIISENESQYKQSMEYVEKSVSDNQYEISRKENSYKQELQALKDGYEIRIKSLQQDLEVVRNDLEHTQQEKYEEVSHYEQKIRDLDVELRNSKHDLEELHHEKDNDIQAYTERLGELEEELAAAQAQHQQEMTQSADDLALAMKAVSCKEVEQLTAEVARLRSQLEAERQRHMSELQTLQSELSGDSDAAAQVVLSSKIQQLEYQIQNMQADYEQELTLTKSAHRRELARSKDDMLGLLAQAEANNLAIDEDSIRKKYLKEIERVKEIYDNGFGTMEKSHQKVMMEMRKAHKREMELLRQEKDQLLEEETKATQAALDAMRKAHEAELQKERNKMLDMLAKTYSHSDVETLQRQHEEDLSLIQREISQLSEQYSMKCLQNASLEQRLDMQTKTLHESRKRVQDLMARNEELNMRIKHELDKLNRIVKTSTGPKDGDTKEIQELKQALQVRDLELANLKSEVGYLSQQLTSGYKELEEATAKQESLYEEQRQQQRRYQAEIDAYRQQIAEMSRLNDAESLDSPRESHASSSSLLSRAEDISEGESEANSPIPKRSKIGTSSSSPSLPASELSRPSSTSGRALPQVSEEARTNKKALWRQRHPQRARSNPGPMLMSLPGKQQSLENLTSGTSKLQRTGDVTRTRTTSSGVELPGRRTLVRRTSEDVLSGTSKQETVSTKLGLPPRLTSTGFRDRKNVDKKDKI